MAEPTRVKVCGLCRARDVAYAARAGADYVGVILSARGPRVQTPESAARILAERGSAAAVGVFVDESVAAMVELARVLALDVAQLHGNESIAAIEALRSAAAVSIWKAVQVREAASAMATIEQYAAHVDGILLDGFAGGAAGGTGTQFDWTTVADVRRALGPDVRLIHAGGLTPENVGDAVAVLGADVVDVSSGVESRTGEKSEDRVRAFIERARPSGKGAVR